jgi:hypothetical protein
LLKLNPNRALCPLAAFLSLAGAALANDPPQVQKYVETASYPVAWANGRATYKLANNGATPIKRLTLDLQRRVPKLEPFWRATYWDLPLSAGILVLPVPDTSAFERDSTAKAANFSGVIVGESDAPSHLGRPYPCYWPDVSSFRLLFDNAFNSGTFWDVDETHFAFGSDYDAETDSVRAFVYDGSQDVKNADFSLGAVASLDIHMRTTVRTVAPEDISKYVNSGTGEVLARAAVRKSGPGGVALWRASFEQLRVLVKP